MEAANLPTFRNFRNTKTSDIYVIFAKESWVATKLGGGAKLGGLFPPGPGLKPPLRLSMYYAVFVYRPRIRIQF